MESAVESPAAISAEESSGSETPTEPSRKVGHANVSGSQPTENAMLKKVLFAVVATGFVTVLALPVRFTAAEAATTCKDAAKMEFPNDRKSRKAFKKECKAAWKASQHG
jgi:hypothetical protein